MSNALRSPLHLTCLSSPWFSPAGACTLACLTHLSLLVTCLLAPAPEPASPASLFDQSRFPAPAPKLPHLPLSSLVIFAFWHLCPNLLLNHLACCSSPWFLPACAYARARLPCALSASLLASSRVSRLTFNHIILICPSLFCPPSRYI